MSDSEFDKCASRGSVKGKDNSRKIQERNKPITYDLPINNDAQIFKEKTEMVLSLIERCDFDSARRQIEKDSTIKEFLLTSLKNDFLKSGKNAFINLITKGRVNDVTKARNFLLKYGITCENINKILNSDEVIKAFQDAFIHKLHFGMFKDFSMTVDVLKDFGIFSKVMNEKFKNSLLLKGKERIICSLSSGNILYVTNILDTIKACEISERSIKQLMFSKEISPYYEIGLMECIRKIQKNGIFSNVSSISKYIEGIKQIGVSKKYIEEVLKREEISNELIIDILNLIKRGDFYQVYSIFELMQSYDVDVNGIKQSLSRGKLLPMCMKHFVGLLQKSKLDAAYNFKDFFQECGVSKELITEMQCSIDECKKSYHAGSPKFIS